MTSLSNRKEQVTEMEGLSYLYYYYREWIGFVRKPHKKR
ncbi:hypothetical protein bcere0016_12180 [Bacillus cereus 95/8201]|nr:hypothetical protein bcere0016_12180 [Bacillus cereus 95/8201]